MAISGMVSTGAANRSYLWVKWNQSSQSTSENATYINYNWGVTVPSGYWWGSNAVKVNNIYINGTLVQSSRIYSNLNGPLDRVLGSGSFRIPHNEDGNKSFNVTINGWFYGNGNVSGSLNFDLNRINRYCTYTYFELRKEDETTLRMDWGVQESYSQWQYRLKPSGGSWSTWAVPKDRYLRNLNFNTSYECQIRVMRSGSSIWSESAVRAQTTYDLPRISSVPATFTAGEQIRVNLNNPLNRTVRVYIEAKPHSGTSRLTVWDKSDVSGGYIDLTVKKAKLYKFYPNHTWGDLAVKLDYGNKKILSEKATKFSAVISDLKPTIGEVTVKDVNAKVQGILQDNQKFLAWNSKVAVTIPSASKMITKYGATPVSYIVSIDNNYGNKEEIVNYTDADLVHILAQTITNESSKLTITAKDSRGVTTTVNKMLNIIKYNPPKLWLQAERLNNFENKTTIKSGTEISTIEGKNKVASVKLYSKKTDDKDYAFKSDLLEGTNDGKGKIKFKDHFENLDNTCSWMIKIDVSDLIQTSSNYIVVQEGKLLVFIGEDGNMYLNDDKVLTEDDISYELIASPNIFMGENDVVEIKKGIKSYPNGVILVWSRYKDGAPREYDFVLTYIHKSFVDLFSGKGMIQQVGRTNIGNKYFYVYNDKIVGNADNTLGESGTFVLRRVIGY